MERVRGEWIPDVRGVTHRRARAEADANKYPDVAAGGYPRGTGLRAVSLV